MKKRCIKLITLFISFTLLWGIVVKADGDYSEEKELTILFTHDMHSHLMETNATGGFARLKTAIGQEKVKNKNVITVDAGDFSMGTLFQTIYTKEAPELRLLGLLGYDATTLGNHEFDYRAQGLIEMLKTAKISNDPLPQLLSSNINWEKSVDPNALNVKNAMEDFGVEEYIIINKGDIKIALFGQLGKDADACAPMSSLEFYDIVESSTRIVNKIKENEDVDMIVCLSHSGTWDDKSVSEDEILAEKVPDIDVIISGHTHKAIQKPIIIDNTIIASAGEYTNNLGKIDLIQNEDGRWHINNYKLIPLNADISEDPMVLEKIAEYKELVQRHYLGRFNLAFDEIIAVSPYDFTPFEIFGEAQEDDTLANLITDSYIYAVKEAEGENYETVDFAISASGIIRDTFTKGDLTVANAFSVSSLGIGPDGVPGYPLVSFYLTGKEIKAAAEVDASISPIMHGAQLYAAGASYTFNPNRLFFNKVTEVKQEIEEGVYEEIDDNKLYRVVAGLYSVQMLGAVKDKSFGLLSITAKTKEGTPILDFEDYIIKSDNGELKEWYALALYLMSFEKENGVSVIPKYYNQIHNRKIINNSKNITELAKSLNKVFFMLLTVVVLVIIIIILLIRSIRKRIYRKSKQKGYQTVA